MKNVFIISLVSLLSSCSYYRFQRINLVKTNSTKAYEQNQDSISMDVFVHINYLDRNEKLFKISDITKSDSSYTFNIDSTIINEEQQAYYERRLEDLNYKGKNSVFGRIYKDEKQYNSQIHLLVSDSVLTSDSLKYSIQNKQISEMHVLKKSKGLSALMLFIIISPIILIISLLFYLKRSIPSSVPLT